MLVSVRDKKAEKIIALSRSFVPPKLGTTSLACIRNKKELGKDDFKGNENASNQ